MYLKFVSDIWGHLHLLLCPVRCESQLDYPLWPPLDQCMPLDPRVVALRALRTSGLRVADEAEWALLLGSVAGIDQSVTTALLLRWAWSSLPEPRPPKAFWRDVLIGLAEAQASPPRVVMAQGVVGGGLAATPHRQKFKQALDRLQPFEVVASLRNTRMAESMKHTHRSALPLYEASCQKLGLPPWPPTDRTLEVFAGYLKESEAYLNPAVYFWAIVEHGRSLGAAVPLERSWVKGLVTGLERDLPVQEQT